MGSTRAAKLSKTFDTILNGQSTISPYNGPQFLESIYTYPAADAVACVDRLVTSKHGRDALQAALRFKLDPATLNGPASRILTFFRRDGGDALAAINDGELLRSVLRKIVDPPIFLNALQNAFVDGDLDDTAATNYAWLVFQLVSFPGESSGLYRHDDKLPAILSTFLASKTLEIRTYGQKIKHVLDTYADASSTAADSTSAMAPPGGRHDNDFPNFRDISIVPTPDEVSCSEVPFIRTADAILDPATEANRTAIHLDNQFRLLREDMLYELREELKLSAQPPGTAGQRRRRATKINNLKAVDVWFENNPNRRERYGIELECSTDLPIFHKIKAEDRLAHIKSKETSRFLRDKSLACLVSSNGDIVAFVTISRDNDLLAEHPRPRIVVHLEGKEGTLKALRVLNEQKVSLLQIDTALFAYEFVLKALQESRGVPLSEELLFWKDGNDLIECEIQADRVVQALRADLGTDLQPLLNTKKPIKLDRSQAESLLSGLTRRVSLIQGPPGTGKSFIGALLAKAIHDYTDLSILVVCFTNHALDDILTSLLDIGIPPTSMVRFGSKASTRTEQLSLFNQRSSSKGFVRPQAEWNTINQYKADVVTQIMSLTAKFHRYLKNKPTMQGYLDFLEFEDPELHAAFIVPAAEDGMTMVDRKGNPIGADYLFVRWIDGNDAGLFKSHPYLRDFVHVWSMPKEEREKKAATWLAAMLKEQVEELYEEGRTYNDYVDRLNKAMASQDIALVKSKRIIGCTTSAAAKNGHILANAAPGVLLVEEAGEILESHILTSLSRQTKQLILIGDHKQLRPKVNKYSLTVEKGDGYDLNRSLFERLILSSYPHHTLSKQHRMKPQISSLVRQLTYPELLDDQSTLSRPAIQGLQSDIVFIDHVMPEDNHDQLADKRDGGLGGAATASKQNTFEVEMVLKIVKYLGQQGYGTQDLVVLTPYLGQLHRLKDAFTKASGTDPVLGDLDSHELVKAGLITAATASAAKKPIRLATIDNYQGEEADIVIISLTRSNPNGEIGFMYSPERLNVLLSRARNGMILIGNSTTFRKSKKGGELWSKLFEMLVQTNSLCEGLPTVCPRHPDRKRVVKTPQEFDKEVPEGGCGEPCGTMLNCGIHACPSSCHNLSDHSKTQCKRMVSIQCPRGHSLARKCFETIQPDCKTCKRLDGVLLKKAEDDLKEKRRREKEEAAHQEELAKIDAAIQQEKEKKKREEELKEQENVIKQRLADLAAMQARNMKTMFPVGSTATPAFMEEPEKRDRNTPMAKNETGSTSGGGGFGSLLSGFTSAITNLASPTSAKPSTPASSSQPSSSTPNTTPQAPTGQQPNPKPKADAFQKRPMTAAEAEWDRQKRVEGAVNPHIEKIMGMVGLEAVKQQMLSIKSKIETSERQGTTVKERFNIVFLGNPGTGKTTVAREYAAFLSYVKVLPGEQFEETSGSRLAFEGVAGTEKLLKSVLGAGGGTIFIDEAYQLTSGNNPGGAQVLDFLLTEMENNVGKLVFILAGYTKEMETFFEFNPGLNSRVPYKIKFEDYTDGELMDMLENLVHSTYKGRMQIEDGLRGLYGRVAIRRLGRRRGTPGFGNARELQTFFDQVRKRQAVRLAEERRAGNTPDDFWIAGADLIGPDPSIAITKSKAWGDLQSLIGLQAVKESVSNLVDSVKENYDRELSEQKPLEFSLNRVFLGPPGTGKTTVAKLYGQILADIGMLSKGEVLVRNPADFVGAVLGESEKKTKGILDNSVGKVLVIDEAYMLYGGGGGDSKQQSNQFKTSVIDTIVAEVQNVPGEDRCVLLLGYEKQMTEMFQNVNPGLARRFKIEEAFRFEDFNDQELLHILEKKLAEQDLGATDAAKAVAIDCLARARTRPNFGNGGEVENLLSKAKNGCLSRRSKIPYSQRSKAIILEPQDFDPDYDRASNASKNLEKLFDDIVGHDEIKSKMTDYQTIAVTCKARGMDPREQIPTNFVFTGPPGTGKTTIARKMGQVYYDMGVLASPEVIECSASDLVGEYVGHTGPKTKALFEKALGKVLFIDEAYRLAEGHFAAEAIDELVGLLTHETFKGKIIVILAGYDQDMKRLMTSNTGLSSRFPEWVPFSNIHPKNCLDIVVKQLQKSNVAADELVDLHSSTYLQTCDIVEQLAELPDWGNARDMVQLAKDIVSKALLAPENANPGQGLRISGDGIVDCAKQMLAARTDRARIQPKQRRMPQFNAPVATANPTPPTPPATGTATETAQATPPPPPPPGPPAQPQGRRQRGRNRNSGSSTPLPQSPPASSSSLTPTDSRPTTPQTSQPPPPAGTAQQATRDPGVSDATWAALQAAIRADDERKRQARDTSNNLHKSKSKTLTKKREAEQKIQTFTARASTEQDARKRAEIERAKLAAIERAARLAEEQERIERELQAAKERKKQEERVQQKLRQMGVCVAGYRWISMGTGYRCAGGSHFISNEQLGI